MSKQDWFRKTTWSEADQADFWSHLRRSRTIFNKAQYLRIQANYLSNRFPTVSLELIEVMIKDFPSRFELASAELLRGEI